MSCAFHWVLSYATRLSNCTGLTKVESPSLREKRIYSIVSLAGYWYWLMHVFEDEYLVVVKIFWFLRCLTLNYRIPWLYYWSAPECLLSPDCYNCISHIYIDSLDHRARVCEMVQGPSLVLLLMATLVASLNVRRWSWLCVKSFIPQDQFFSASNLLRPIFGFFNLVLRALHFCAACRHLWSCAFFSCRCAITLSASLSSPLKVVYLTS